MIRVLLADSHQLLHLGIHTALSANHKIRLIDSVTCASQLRQYCHQHQPDVVLLATNIVDSAYIDVINDVQQQCPTAKILVLLRNPNEVSLQQLIEASVTGAILKSDTPEKLSEAVQTVATQESWFSPILMRQLLQTPIGDDHSNRLTERETDVLQLIAVGKTDKETAQALGIAERTVRYHLQNINNRLGTTTRVEAVAEAIRRKIIP